MDLPRLQHAPDVHHTGCENVEWPWTEAGTPILPAVIENLWFCHMLTITLPSALTRPLLATGPHLSTRILLACAGRVSERYHAGIQRPAIMLTMPYVQALLLT
jgi:hypothetical protein